MNDDREIILGKSWIAVSSEDMLTNSRTIRSTWAREIIGSSDDKFGYLVQSQYETASVRIIDPETVQIYYHPIEREGP